MEGEEPTGVEMAVEVNHGHGAVGTVDGAQQRQGDGVVAAEGDDTGESAALDGRASLVGVSGRRAGQEVVVSLLNLMQRPGVVISGRVSLANVPTGRCWACLTM